MNITSLAKGLLLLAKLHPKGKLSISDDLISFYVLTEDQEFIDLTNKELLENLGWSLVEERELIDWIYNL